MTNENTPRTLGELENENPDGFVNTEPGLEFEVYFETDCGMDSDIIAARSVADFMRQMRAKYPDDIGADGFYTHPITGAECALDW